MNNLASNKLKAVFLSIFIFLSSALSAQNIYRSLQYSIGQLLEDLLFLRHKMETNNVNLYLYNSKKTVDSAFDMLYKGIDKPMTASQFYYYITAIQPFIKDGHNYLLPDKELQQYYSGNVLYFPLNFTEYEGRLYITQNLSDDSTLQTGDEIRSINRKNAATVFNTLVSHQVRDGNNLLYPQYISQTYFRSYYGFSFDFPNEYQLEIVKPDGKNTSITLKALPLAEIQKRRKTLPEPRYDRIDFDKGISWETDTAKHYCILNIRTWSTALLKSEYKQKFRPIIDLFINELKAGSTRDLIIDLRGNQGGDGQNGIYLLQHLLDKPFNYFYSVKAYTKKQQLKNAAPLLTKKHYPKDYVFKGNVYILTNSGSFSNSAIFSALIQFLKRGKIVGSETGGNGIVLSGGDGYYVAPNTKINLLKVTNQMTTSGTIKNTGEGIKPDIEIKPTLKNILDNDDVVLKQLLALITDRK